jgi:RHH-type rel operon transcriptional repressor/antitoxin RelB
LSSLFAVKQQQEKLISFPGRLDKETIEKLKKLADATKRSKSFLVAEAVDRYLHEQEWQVTVIKDGLQQAEKGQFAADTVEARSVLCYWAARELGISALELSRKLGISQPTASQSTKRGERTQQLKRSVLFSFAVRLSLLFLRRTIRTISQILLIFFLIFMARLFNL